MKKVKIPFSLDEYNKGGYEVENKHGRKVRIMCTDTKGYYPISGLVDVGDYESYKTYLENGNFQRCRTSDDDLVLIKPEFEEGDIVYTKNSAVEMISIFNCFDKNKGGNLIGTISAIAVISWGKEFIEELIQDTHCDIGDIRLATEEEKQKLFDALAKKGKRWNAETKQIESIEDEKETNWVSSGIISTNEVIFRKEENGLRRGCFVLARDGKDQSWELDIFGRHDNEYTGGYTCVGGCYDYCIPFDSETEHLHGTTEDCPSKYKAWKD